MLLVPHKTRQGRASLLLVIWLAAGLSGCGQQAGGDPAATGLRLPSINLPFWRMPTFGGPPATTVAATAPAPGAGLAGLLGRVQPAQQPTTLPQARVIRKVAVAVPPLPDPLPMAPPAAVATAAAVTPVNGPQPLTPQLLTPHALSNQPLPAPLLPDAAPTPMGASSALAVLQAQSRLN